MSQLIVISALGLDRTGIVQDLTKIILSCDGNIEESRMTTLGSEFAMLLLVSGNWTTLNKLEKGLKKLEEEKNLTISIRQTGNKLINDNKMPYSVDIICLDQQGIVFNLAEFFSKQDVEITDVVTRSYSAAYTGSTMFAVQMSISIPATLQISRLREEFLEVCDLLNLDAILEPVKNNS
ncbi:MAG: glycine cleavage system protein R [Gammaproteobacteria bacterium]|nr:glycine cleavage system protein R [Gammaproteobacteria bacterium]|tara:strand:- start:2727 stop:3263 length:537 start_codon:yes stop_codon:yes gene_type:complete